MMIKSIDIKCDERNSISAQACKVIRNAEISIEPVVAVNLRNSQYLEIKIDLSGYGIVIHNEQDLGFKIDKEIYKLLEQNALINSIEFLENFKNIFIDRVIDYVNEIKDE